MKIILAYPKSVWDIVYMNEATNKIEAKLAGLGIIELSNVLIAMAKDMSDAAGLVLEIGMNVMESKMNETDFVRFCSQLENVQ